MPDVPIAPGESPTIIPIYLVVTADETVTLPASPRVVDLLRSWLGANHFHETEGGWEHETLPEPVDFERALGHCATFE